MKWFLRFKEHLFIALIFSICFTVFVGTAYSAFDFVFGRCNGGVTRTIEVWDTDAGRVLHENVCANGSHWVWEKDPGPWKTEQK